MARNGCYVLLVVLFLLVGCGGDEADSVLTDPDAGNDTHADNGDISSRPDDDVSELDATPAPDGGEDASADDSLLVTVSGGTLRGEIDGDARAFLGIPYATPPLDALRWSPPEPTRGWDGVRDATQLSSECVQPIADYLAEQFPDQATMGSEDCLYLNVWAPPQPMGQSALPVMVFLHGGGNVYGSTAEPLAAAVNADTDAILYDGARLATRGDVVVVTINYRLGVLGYLSHPFLDDAGDTGFSGNYGLMDQILALEWIQENIGAFGGDPERVLLFGQSGGGRDVNLLATSPLTDGLFSRVIMHSAPLGASALEPVRERAEALVQEMGCADDTLACMRAADPFEMAVAEASRPVGLANAAFLPTVDGYVVTSQPRDVVSSGAYRGTPIVFGTTDAEYSHRWPDMTEQGYAAAVAAMIGPEHVDAVMAQYPSDVYGSPTEAFAIAMSDRNVSCPHTSYARTIANASYDAYFYRFQQVLPVEVAKGFGAYHTSDLVYLFQHLDGVEFEATDNDRRTQDWMVDLWSHFAHHGSFDAYDAIAWPTFELADEAYLTIGPELGVAEHLKAEECAFWNTLR